MTTFDDNSIEPKLVTGYTPTSIASTDYYKFDAMPTPAVTSNASLTVTQVTSATRSMHEIASEAHAPPTAGTFTVNATYSDFFAAVANAAKPIIEVSSTLIFRFFVEIFSHLVAGLSSWGIVRITPYSTPSDFSHGTLGGSHPIPAHSTLESKVYNSQTTDSTSSADDIDSPIYPFAQVVSPSHAFTDDPPS